MLLKSGENTANLVVNTVSGGITAMVFIASDNVPNASKISGSSACLFPILSLIILSTAPPYFVEAPTST